MMFLLYSISPIVELGSLVASFSTGRASVDRLASLWDLPSERTDDSNTLDGTGKSLVLDGVSYSYPQAPEPVVENFSMELDKPGVYTLTGPNGAGKSTLLSIINGTYPADGNIRINGRDSSELTPQAWRSNVLLVSPDREPIVGTLRDNLGVDRSFLDEEKMAAANVTGLADHYPDLDGLGDEHIVIAVSHDGSLAGIADGGIELGRKENR